jgi:hypothetical protein
MPALNVDVLLPTLQPIFAGSVRVWRSHQINADGEDLVQADLTSLELEVFKESDASQVGSWTLAIPDVIYDTLQTASGVVTWKADGDGFNLLHKTSPDMTPDAGETYLFIYKATPGDGDPWYFGFRQPTFSKRYS